MNELLTRYYRLMPTEKQRALTDKYQQARSLVKSVLKCDNKLVPSHNDLVLENILLEGIGIDEQKIWLVDWEYASMASPYWDLATLCNQAGFTPDQEESLLKLYQINGSILDLILLKKYRDLLDALSTFWMAAFTSN